MATVSTSFATSPPSYPGIERTPSSSSAESSLTARPTETVTSRAPSPTESTINPRANRIMHNNFRDNTDIDPLAYYPSLPTASLPPTPIRTPRSLNWSPERSKEALALGPDSQAYSDWQAHLTRKFLKPYDEDEPEEEITEEDYIFGGRGNRGPRNKQGGYGMRGEKGVTWTFEETDPYLGVVDPVRRSRAAAIIDIFRGMSGHGHRPKSTPKEELSEKARGKRRLSGCGSEESSGSSPSSSLLLTPPPMDRGGILSSSHSRRRHGLSQLLSSLSSSGHDYDDDNEYWDDSSAEDHDEVIDLHAIQPAFDGVDSVRSLTRPELEATLDRVYPTSSQALRRRHSDHRHPHSYLHLLHRQTTHAPTSGTSKRKGQSSFRLIRALPADVHPSTRPLPPKRTLSENFHRQMFFIEHSAKLGVFRFKKRVEELRHGKEELNLPGPGRNSYGLPIRVTMAD